MTRVQDGRVQQRTPAVAGALLIAGAALQLLLRLVPFVAVTDRLFVAVPQDLLAISAGAAVLAAFIVLALGLQTEGGVAGGSVLGRAALIVWGAGALLGRLVVLLPFGAGSVTTVLVVLAAVVARACVLSGAARWLLVPAAVLQLVLGASSFVPVPIELVPAEIAVGSALDPVLIATGVALLLVGRSEAVRARPSRGRRVVTPSVGVPAALSASEAAGALTDQTR